MAKSDVLRMDGRDFTEMDVLDFLSGEAVENYLQFQEIMKKGEVTPIVESSYATADRQTNTILKIQLAKYHFQQSALRKKDIALKTKRLSSNDSD